MGIADKKYSNVDKKTTEILEEAKLLLEEEGYEVSKPREKSIARELMNAAYGNAFKTMSKDPDLTVRKICLKAIEDKFFDIIWGSAVLHHLDHQKFSKEIVRILKPGGSVIFVDEPTFFNPIIKFAYETLYGKGLENRRRKFLFFTRTGDDLEKPIDSCDLFFYEKYSH